MSELDWSFICLAETHDKPPCHGVTRSHFVYVFLSFIMPRSMAAFAGSVVFKLHFKRLSSLALRRKSPLHGGIKLEDYMFVGNKTTMPFFVIAALSISTLSAHALDGGDAAKGKKIFNQCKACHMVGEDAKTRVGPVLNDVIGRTAGTAEGAEKRYSKFMIEAGAAGLVWTEDELFTYLADPTAYLREKLGNDSAKSKMVKKLKKEDQRKNVIAYLKTFSPDAPSE